MSAAIHDMRELKQIADLERRVKALEARDYRGLAEAAPGPVPMDRVEDVVLEFGNDASVIREPKLEERYRDRSCVIVCPTRGMIATEVAAAQKNLVMPMNQKWNGPMFAVGYEVGAAYNALIEGILAHPFLKTWRYVLTLEDDNGPPFDAVLRLMETLEAGPSGDGSSEWDAVSGLYFTKDSVHSPMAYGDAEEFHRTGYANFYPVDLSKVPYCASSPCEDQRCLKHVLECNGIAMGCALWKMEMFKQIPAPWFVTCNDKILVCENGENKLIKPDEDGLFELEPGKGYKKLVTQDLSFCNRAIEKPFNKRFAVDLRVKVGHLDVSTGRWY